MVVKRPVEAPPYDGLRLRFRSDLFVPETWPFGGTMTRAAGRSLELFFIDGRPEGMLTAEVFNWTGHVLMAPRTMIGDALKRPESRYTGVYMLIGEQDGVPFACIGEAEDVSDRIRNHDARKDWWTTAIIITSAANNLNKAHVRYLEARLIEEAHSIAKIALENGNNPSRPGLSEAAQANMEAFLEYVLLVLPALRIDYLLRNTRPNVRRPEEGQVSDEVVTFALVSNAHDLRATARHEDGEFVVLKGSDARASWEGSGGENTAPTRRHAELIRTGILAENGAKRVFTENYAFRSPSATAAAVIGRHANGTIEWKVAGTNRTYKQWEADSLATEAPGE